VWLPGVAFDIVDWRTRPLLDNVERFSVVTTFGTRWWRNMAMRGPPRLAFAPGMCRRGGRRCGSQNTALTAPARPRARFLKKVEDGMRSL